MKLTIAQLLEKHSIPEPNSGCLLWLASVDGKGYGRLRVDGVLRPAHRVSWEEVNGPMPDHLLACHKCDVNGCIEPSHVFPGTHRENMDDMLAKRRQVLGERNGRALLTEELVIQVKQAKGSHLHISAQFGISPTNSCMIRRGRRWKHIEGSIVADTRWMVGENNPRAVLTPDQVDEIRRSTQSSRALAQKYGVNPSTIQRVKNGLRWRAK